MDHILYWNAVALEANRRDFSNASGTEDPSPEQRGPTLSSKALAIVHQAMYDAYAGCVGSPSLPGYNSAPGNPSPGANAAAATRAAYKSLLWLYPTQKNYFDECLAAAQLSGPGIELGDKFGASGTSSPVATPHLTLYETPARGVFMTRDGELRRDVLANEVVRPLVDLASDSLGVGTANRELNVAQIPLSTMSDAGGSLLGDALGVSRELADGLKLMGEAISVISVVGTVATATLKVMELIGFGVGEEVESPYDELYRRIEQRLRGMLKATLAGQTLNTMQQMTLLLGHSQTAGAIVGAFLREPTPARQAQLPQADYWSQYAVNTLRGEALWLRTYDPDASIIKVGGSRGWEFGPAVSADMLMWDWRLPLLAYLKALAARIAVIHAIDPGVDKSHRAEILGHATFLQTVEQRIRAGFSRSLPGVDAGWPYWEVTARDACGVIDVQTGESDFTGSFMPAYWFRDPIDAHYASQNPQPKTHAKYVEWHQHSVNIRYWRLYDRLGLFALWSIIPDVKASAKGMPGVGMSTKLVLETYHLQKSTRISDGLKTRIAAQNLWSEKAQAASG